MFWISIVRQYGRAVIFRLGRYLATRGPGLVLIHSTGIVINGAVRGGRNVLLEHQVTARSAYDRARADWEKARATRARAAAMFTRNRFPGAPVIVGRKHIARGFAQALVINSKNANVAMGKIGIDNAIETCRIVGVELDINPYDVLPFSTGVIGRPLPMDKIRAGLRGIKGELKPNNLRLAAEAIMTTDKYPKYYSRRIGPAVVAGIAKGANIIPVKMWKCGTQRTYADQAAAYRVGLDQYERPL